MPHSRIVFEITPKTRHLNWLHFGQASNFHGHLRTGALREAVARDTMMPWHYLLVMPNTAPNPITTIEEMLAYRQELIEIRDRNELDTRFIMTLYLTDRLTPKVVEQMRRLDFPCAVKYYPPHQGATTGSGHGIPLKEAKETLHAMEENGIRLLGHFESPYDKHGKELPHELREGYFMEHEYGELRDSHPNLLITIEHATTAKAIDRVKEDWSDITTCTITPQAMLLERKDLDTLTWGRHAKCMPIAKTPEDRHEVVTFATSGDFRAFLGDDTAPHASKSKYKPFPEAASGCYLPHSLAIYAAIFHKEGMLMNLPAFASYNGIRSWGLERPGQRTLLLRETVTDIPKPVAIPGVSDEVIPFGWTTGKDAYHPGLKLFVPQ